jgi:hypothetical protein
VKEFLDQVVNVVGFDTFYSLYHFADRSHYDTNVTINSLNTKTDKAMVAGHFTSRIFQVNPALQDCFKITVLREPVDRAISAFFFHQHQFKEVDKCLGNTNATPLVESKFKKYLRLRCRNYWQYQNDMTARLAGFSELPWKSYRTNRKLPNGPPPVNMSHQIEAKRNLKELFDLVCFLDDLPSCAQKVLSTFQLVGAASADIDVSAMTTNRSSVFKTNARPSNVSDEITNKFLNANQLDLVLYRWAWSEFSEVETIVTTKLEKRPF